MAAFIDAQGATQQFEMSLDVVREAGALRRCPSGTSSTRNSRLMWKPTATLLATLRKRRYRPEVQQAARHPFPSLAQALGGRTVLKPGPSCASHRIKGRLLLMPAIGALAEDKLLSDLEMNAAASTTHDCPGKTPLPTNGCSGRKSTFHPEAARSVRK